MTSASACMIDRGPLGSVSLNLLPLRFKSKSVRRFIEKAHRRKRLGRLLIDWSRLKGRALSEGRLKTSFLLFKCTTKLWAQSSNVFEDNNGKKEPITSFCIKRRSYVRHKDWITEQCQYQPFVKIPLLYTSTARGIYAVANWHALWSSLVTNNTRGAAYYHSWLWKQNPQ